MNIRLSNVTILVRDQEEALRWYTETLGLEKRDDQKMGPNMRWLTVAPKGQADVAIVLQQPDLQKHGDRIGQGTTWVLQTDDCRATYAALRKRGVVFSDEPKDRPYGVEAVLEDLYGNRFALVQPR